MLVAACRCGLECAPDHPRLGALEDALGVVSAWCDDREQGLFALESATEDAGEAQFDVMVEETAILWHVGSAVWNTAMAAWKAGEYHKAHSYAVTALSKAPAYRDSWAYGEVYHVANIVIGHLALTVKRTDLAERHLLRAAQTQGSPRLEARGPDRSAPALARWAERNIGPAPGELAAPDGASRPGRNSSSGRR